MGRYLGALLSVVVAAGIVIGVISAIGYYSHEQPAVAAENAGQGPGSYKHVSIHLQTFPNNPYEDPDFVAKYQSTYGNPPPAQGDNLDWVTYWPNTNMVVPTHALVTITIDNYDGATTLLNPYYAVPHGVVNDATLQPGPIYVNNNPVTSVDPTNVSHTFTIHSVVSSSQPWLFVSVPVTAVSSDAKTDAAGLPLQPMETQFSFVTPDKPGDYIWQCFDPCGTGFNGFGGPMSTKGYMSGTLSVVSQ
jgi:hypothetical protein